MEDTNEAHIITSSSVDAYADASSSLSSMYLTAHTESIEESKVHWSNVVESESDSSDDETTTSECESDSSDDQIVADNNEMFKSLQELHEWGCFFHVYNEEAGPIVMEGKFAEGGQAKIFNVFVKEQPNIPQGEREAKWVLKVFKKRTVLQTFRAQWPRGYFQWRAQLQRENPAFCTFVATVVNGLLLPTGQYAFLIKKETEDLRSLIVRKRPYRGYAFGPFEKMVVEIFFYQIASGMDWLHKHDVIHRDIKASNVLVTNNICYVADFECSIGVIGTRYWRDPHILQACIEGNVFQRPELFSRAADVYGYGMTCYEILTGKLPFEEEYVTMDLVIKGQRPTMPEIVDVWIKDLICKCWDTNCDARPTFEEILNIIVANTTSSYIKCQHELRLKVNNEELNPLLGCNNQTHALEMMECPPYESGVYVCKLCFKEGNGRVQHCSSCGDFDLHPECATLPIRMETFLHPHFMYLLPSFERKGRRMLCDACGLDIVEGKYYGFYTCYENCDFDLHIHCAKYARAISHPLHEEHELELINLSTSVGVGKCNCCNIKLGSSEIRYCCRECGFNIHPHCIIGKLECKSW